ncbi:hypothetical protein C8R42DRAFT_464659 [Lentinula raphanica]|nr:hypothetical protein C8R42DRAFT_464659 [Lentinula raphanica]
MKRVEMYVRCVWRGLRLRRANGKGLLSYQGSWQMQHKSAKRRREMDRKQPRIWTSHDSGGKNPLIRFINRCNMRLPVQHRSYIFERRDVFGPSHKRMPHRDAEISDGDSNILEFFMVWILLRVQSQ